MNKVRVLMSLRVKLQETIDRRFGQICWKDSDKLDWECCMERRDFIFFGFVVFLNENRFHAFSDVIFHLTAPSLLHVSKTMGGKRKRNKSWGLDNRKSYSSSSSSLYFIHFCLTFPHEGISWGCKGILNSKTEPPHILCVSTCGILCLIHTLC